MTARRKICVFTGSRAEYGLLSKTMRRIQEDPALELQVLVSGAHLSDTHGATWTAIAADGFTIDAKVEMDLSDDTPLGLARATGQAVSDLAAALAGLAPDILVVLGDRYEAFAAAAAAMLLRLPIAHIHGGETTAGAIDEAIRHAITKMAHIHFAAAPLYGARIRQLGEAPESIFVVGAPGLELIDDTAFLDAAALSAEIGFELGPDVFVITYHPETIERSDPGPAVDRLLEALDSFPRHQMVFTMANADIAGRVINERLRRYVDRHPGRMFLTASLGLRRYMSLVRLARVVIGNSSSGVIEAPSLGIPAVNIGTRQKGRLQAPSVIDCDGTAEAIRAAVTQAVSEPHQRLAAAASSPLKRADTADSITAALKQVPLDRILVKTFHDLPVGAGA